MTSVKNEVQNIICEMIKNRRLFTAHDVTKLLRHRLDGENISHNDVKKEVYAMFENDDMGIYTRSQINIGPGVTPFIYHLGHQDPVTDYNKDWVNTTIQLSNATGVNAISGVKSVSSNVKPIRRVGKAPTPTKNTVYPSTIDQIKLTNQIRQIAQSNNDGFLSKTVTSEGRLTIPTKMLSTFKGDVYVKVGKVQKNGTSVDSLVISNDPQGAIKTYKINADGRLRISSKFLNKLGGNSVYSIKSANNSIFIVTEK